MSDNVISMGLQKSGPRKAAIKQDRQAWIARGNRLLWGEEADRDGVFLSPRRDLEWRHDGSTYYIATVGNGRS